MVFTASVFLQNVSSCSFHWYVERVASALVGEVELLYNLERKGGLEETM